MRILLDEDLPRRLAELLVGHEVSTVQRSGWSGIKNGQLLELASAQFDVFVTMDRNLPFQQNLAALPIAVLVVEAVSNRMEHLTPMVPADMAFVVNGDELILPTVRGGVKAMLDCQIGNAAGPSVATVDQADIRALGSGMTAVRRGAASV